MSYSGGYLLPGQCDDIVSSRLYEVWIVCQLLCVTLEKFGLLDVLLPFLVYNAVGSLYIDRNIRNTILLAIIDLISENVQKDIHGVICWDTHRICDTANYCTV